MALKSIEKVDFTNEKVLVRVDFNIETAEEHFRLDIVKKTIDHLLSFQGVKVALLTHLGRPVAKESEFSIEKLIPAIEKTLQRKVIFVSDCIGEKVENALATLNDGELLLLENVRFYSEEEKNDAQFAEQLAKPFTQYINEAFSVSHRAHASVEAITRFLPSFAGFRVVEEVTELDRVRFSPDRPAIAIIGGAKIETKLPLLKALEKSYDCILVGGKIANEALDQKIEFSPKVQLPQDFESPFRFDIGPKTIAYYTQMIRTAKTVVWNGPMGMFEQIPYNIGTRAVLDALLRSGAYIVIGGGESLAVLEKAGVMDKIGFVSSGGGAMLEYMSDKVLPGLVPLEA